MTEGGGLSLLVAAGAGLLSFLSPCVLPLFPSYLSFLGGISCAELQEASADPRIRWRLLGNALMFILGFSLVFIAFGASFSLLGSLLFEYQVIIRRAGGVLIILFGLYAMGWMRIPFLMREKRFHLRSRPAGYLGAFAVGVTFAAGWTPCVGPILGSILVYAGTAETARTGILMLAAYSAGLALPFLGGALALTRVLPLLDRFKKLLPAVSVVSGLLLITVGSLLLTDYFTILSSYALRLTPEWLWKRL